MGYEAKKVVVGESTSLDIILKTQSAQLEEVMITAEFGMKRLAKSVGSSAQTVSPSDITESGRSNFVTALQGRVSGLNVVSTSGAPGASNHRCSPKYNFYFGKQSAIICDRWGTDE